MPILDSYETVGAKSLYVKYSYDSIQIFAKVDKLYLMDDQILIRHFTINIYQKIWFNKVAF